MPTAILACPGPSLRQEINHLLNCPLPILCVNRAIRNIPWAKHVAVVDPPKAFNQKHDQPLPKGSYIHTTPAFCTKWPDRDYHLVRYETKKHSIDNKTDLFTGKEPIPMHGLNERFNHGTIWGINVLLVNGADRILLCGSELHTKNGRWSTKSQKPDKEQLPIYEQVILRMTRIAPFIKDKIIYCNPGGNLQHLFETMPLVDAIAKYKDDPCPEFRT